MILLGYGKTNKAIAKHLNDCKIYDDTFKDKVLDKYGNYLLPTSNLLDGEKDTAIISPGIPPSSMLAKKAKNIISEYDYFYEQMPYSVWISGTNGKSTLTQMCEHILSPYNALSGGNIGVPLADMNKDANMWLLETSSFTFHYTKTAKPNFYVLLPITQDHISWHGSFEAYKKAKLKPFAQMQRGEAIIAPYELKDIKTKGFKILYKDHNDLAKRCGIDISKIHFKGAFLLNATIALCISKILFNKINYEALNSFKIPKHRLQSLKDSKGRIWINDTKATNPDASLQALKAYKNASTYLIIGGDDKGANTNALFEYIQDIANIEVFLIGKSTDKFANLCAQKGIKYIKSYYLKEALKQIDLKHTKDSIALLSPACSSLDQYSSYEKRGDEFIEFVQNLAI